MLFYVLKRIIYICCILVVMSMLVFAITQILPGNVARMILGQFATEESIRAIEEKLRLNDPLVVQYWRWASSLLSGDLGESLILEYPIAPLLSTALKRSAILAVMSFFFVTVVGIGLGVVAALKQNRPTDHAVSIFTYLSISVPEFFWGIVVIIFLARYIDWLPSSGYEPLSDGFWNWLSHLILPVSTLTFALIAHVSRLTRSCMLETLRSPYVTAARAKGLPERIVLVRHALRNALLPTITILAVDLGWLFGGIVVVETVFAFPGLGRLLMFSVERHDLPLMQVSLLLITAVYSVSNLIADLLYTYFNPKIRYERSAD